MFGFSRQPKKTDAVEVAEKPIATVDQAARDRRKISGQRVSCVCEFRLVNTDAFSHAKIHTSGKIVLNVRGCCVYPKRTLSVENTKKTFPDTKVLTIQNMVITGTDGESFKLPDLTIRRVRLVSDKHGDGIILRFVDLTDQQLDTLVSITDRYTA